MDVVYGTPTPEPRSRSEYASQLKEMLEQSYQTVCEHFQSEAKRQKLTKFMKTSSTRVICYGFIVLWCPAVSQGSYTAHGGCIDLMERGTVEWNGGTVEWNGGMVERWNVC